MSAPPPWRTNMTGSGSYTTVDTRKTFGAPKVLNAYAGITAAPTPTPARTTFPDKLKQYVARTFEDCPAEAKVEVEAELKRIITNAFNDKIVWTVNWDEMPLPQTIMANRKAGAKDKSRENSTSDESPTHSFSKFSLSEKKRKSSGDDHGTSPSKSQDRQEKRSRNEGLHSPSTDKLSQREKEKRARRFGINNTKSPPAPSRSSPAPQNVEIDQPLVGRCQNLEKRYFRLTSAPNPDDVRPLHILQQTLELLKKKWRNEQNYSYICDQFKSLRQDLTVQHIKTDFTVLVYEIHARIALEKSDLGEYNQCQSQLASLYASGLKGREEEFKAYRILYLLHTCNRADMNEVLANLTPADKQRPAIRHALDVRSALAVGNYHKFFRLYLEAPGMGGYLMDSFVSRERMAALACICRAYRPDIDIRFLTEELGFESDTECVTFLVDNGAQEYIEQKSNDKGVPNSIRFQTTKAAALFEAAKQQAFRKVDIKGQM